jgi:glucosylceramidase
MWGITIENEPGAGPNVNYSFNSLGFTAETQRDFLKMDLGPILTKAGYDKNKLKIMIYDDQRPDMVKWADVILKDAESAKYASGIAFHWYNNKDENLNNLNIVHEGHPNHFILATESSQPFGTNSVGSFNTAENYAHDIITVCLTNNLILFNTIYFYSYNFSISQYYRICNTLPLVTWIGT